jgi:hypothetical protein
MMFPDVARHSAGNQVCRIAENNEQLPGSVAQAIDRLLSARRYAEGTDRNIWEFALTIAELRRDGVTESDLRWLVCRGFIEHANEVATTSGERTFDRNVNLRFCKRTAFVITDAGVVFSDELLDGYGINELDSGVGVRFIEGAPELAGPRLVEDRRKNFNTNLRPNWDRDRRELRLGGELVKVFKLPSPMQEAILAAFEEEGWPPRIDDPLPVHPELMPKRRLHDTVKSLNRNQKNSLIRFMGDGTGEGIRWEWNTAAFIPQSHETRHAKSRA